MCVCVCVCVAPHAWTFVAQATVLTLGHSHPAVAEVIKARAGKGTAFFGPSRYEVELAELLKERIPSMEHVRLTGTFSLATHFLIQI
eukprot:COSAG03_NODE_639_length_6562_cov_16.796844_1_plen_87_part_00